MAVDPRQIIVDNLPGSTATVTEPPNRNAAVSTYSYEQDTNRLARGNPENTVIVTRDSTRRQNIPTGLSINTWEEPLAAYGASYPHNHVYQTPNGLVQEFDDTPNNVRYHRYHPAGTYVEVDSNGTEVRKIVGDNYYIVERNGYIFIGGEANITVSGKCNILVTNDVNLQIDGKLDAVVKNDINLTTSGNFNLNVKETFKVRAENYVLETKKYDHDNLGQFNFKTDSLIQQINRQDTKVTGEGKFLFGKLDIGVDNDFITSSSSLSMQASGKIVIDAVGKMSIDGSEVLIGGSTLHLKAGTVRATRHQKEAIGSEFFLKTEGGPSSPEAASSLTVPNVTNPQLTGLVVPASRAFPDRSDRPALRQTVNRSERAAIINDETPRQGIGTSGNIARYNDPAAQIPVTGTAAPSTPVDSSTFINTTTFTGEEQISKYFKLKDVTTNTKLANINNSIRAQKGLTVGQIASNLQALSVNILDILVERYGRNSFWVTSGFRRGENQLQHGEGRAVDIQFLQNNSRIVDRDWYRRLLPEIITIVPFDQTILEFNGSSIWIHMSFNSQGNRRQYFTMDVARGTRSPISVLPG